MNNLVVGDDVFSKIINFYNRYKSDTSLIGVIQDYINNKIGSILSLMNQNIKDGKKLL